MNDMHHFASVSWGKDSLAMLLGIVERGMPLDEVVFFDTGAEFNAIYDTMERFRDENPGVRVRVLRPREPFFFTMYARTVRRKGVTHHHGYSWCGGRCRWGTKSKTATIDTYVKEHSNGSAVQYVGIAADETPRIERAKAKGKVLPLVDWGMTEADCLAYCRESGYNWAEDGVSLYDVLDRVSCWCCRNKNMGELRRIRDCLPKYWERLLALEDTLGQMKTKPLREL